VAPGAVDVPAQAVVEELDVHRDEADIEFLADGRPVTPSAGALSTMQRVRNRSRRQPRGRD
jgi:hypothetical protein